MKRGFTLIELIVVIIIIGVLAALAVPQYLRVTEKAKQAEGVRILGVLRGAQQRYYVELATYTSGPSGLDNLDVTFRYKYFNVPIPLNPGAGDTPLGSVVRNAVALPTGYTYTLYIYKDGTISYSGTVKTDTGPSSTRPGL